MLLKGSCVLGSKLIKKIETLCLVDLISVVTSSLALNLASLESLFISLSRESDVPFVRIIHLLDEQHN